MSGAKIGELELGESKRVGRTECQTILCFSRTCTSELPNPYRPLWGVPHPIRASIFFHIYTSGIYIFPILFYSRKFNFKKACNLNICSRQGWPLILKQNLTFLTKDRHCMPLKRTSGFCRRSRNFGLIQKMQCSLFCYFRRSQHGIKANRAAKILCEHYLENLLPGDANSDVDQSRK